MNKTHMTKKKLYHRENSINVATVLRNGPCFRVNAHRFQLGARGARWLGLQECGRRGHVAGNDQGVSWFGSSDDGWCCAVVLLFCLMLIDAAICRSAGRVRVLFLRILLSTTLVPAAGYAYMLHNRPSVVSPSWNSSACQVDAVARTPPLPTECLQFVLHRVVT